MGWLILNVIRRWKYIPFEQWCSQVRIFGGHNRVAQESAQEVKQGLGLVGKLK